MRVKLTPLLIGVFVTLTLLTVAAILFFASARATQLLQRQLSHELTVDARSASNQIKDFVQLQHAAVRIIAGSDLLAQADSARVTTYLKRCLTANPAFAELFRVNRAGMIDASTVPEYAGHPFSTQERESLPALRAALGGRVGEIFLKDAHSDEESAKPEMLLLSPIVPSGGGQPTGVLVAAVNIEGIREVMQELFRNTPGTHPAYLLNEEGRLIYSEDLTAKLFEPVPEIARQAALGTAMRTTHEGAVPFTTQEGQVLLAGFSTVPIESANVKSRWSVLAVSPQQDLTQPVRALQQQLALTGILGVAVAAVAIFFLARSIAEPVVQLTALTTRAASQHDLTVRAGTGGPEELGRLGGALNNLLDDFQQVSLQTQKATENVAAAAAQILASAQQQAASSSEQAAAVQETTATMEEIRQSGLQISEKARQVAAAAEATSSISSAGLEAVQTLNRGMGSIRDQAETVAENIVSLSEKTQAVGEIIASVNDIAEQSNLLALNAAIEAAAAGEQGRSFSVVASEMKNLADQSKEATVRIRSILGDIQKGINTSVMLTEEAVKRVESGAEQAEVADRTIRQMADSILQSVQAFQQIVAATNQQQIGFEQVTQAIQNIRQATDQTALGTRQLEAATAGLNTMGRELKETVEVYRL